MKRVRSSLSDKCLDLSSQKNGITEIGLVIIFCSSPRKTSSTHQSLFLENTKKKKKIISQSQDLRKKKVKVGKEIKAFSRIRKQSSMEYRKAREWILTDPIGVQNLLRYRSCFFL